MQRDSLFEVAHRERFVGTVRAAIRQAEANQQRVASQHALEQRHDRDAQSLAHQCRLAAKDLARLRSADHQVALP